jgi:hypothetical protein
MWICISTRHSHPYRLLKNVSVTFWEVFMSNHYIFSRHMWGNLWNLIEYSWVYHQFSKQTICVGKGKILYQDVIFSLKCLSNLLIRNMTNFVIIYTPQVLTVDLNISYLVEDEIHLIIYTTFDLSDVILNAFPYVSRNFGCTL